MEGNEIRRVQEVFLAVLDLAASDRSEEVLRQCCGDRTLAHAVFEMIEEDARHNRLLDSDLSTLAIAALPSHNYLSIASQQVGRYRLLRLLGEGGMRDRVSG